ncbi:hypothetical protein [Phyllobacterium sp. OV277]|uniref:hypothetical protein n=1 Tax=Phyllobacterium sp. OV277 TaxID=1882772 RepID=UPI00088EEC54|nr:hypothetical protein [Phyllobacterium sp. OV277]SDP08900.1 hypothetical protein SAMN05443582_103370 [Phyllobacterium sp. OV277]
MQKINVLSIIICHLKSLCDDKGKFFLGDIVTFYVMPIFLGVASVFLGWQMPEKALELSISVFSIFAALLLSVQVALYGVSLRPIAKPEDPKKLKDFEQQKAFRRALLRELNDNISYLILLSVVTVTITLILFFFNAPRVIGSGLAIALYCHFFLTLLMVIKRASIVFSREYEGSDLSNS